MTNPVEEGTETLPRFDIALPAVSKVLPGVKLYPMPQPNPGAEGSAGLTSRSMDIDEAGCPRVDTRTATARNGEIYVGGGGADSFKHLWNSTDSGRTWTHQRLGQGHIGDGFGILADDTFIFVYTSPGPSRLWVIRSTDCGKSWGEPVELDVRPYPEADGGWSHVYAHPDGTAMITMQLRLPGELLQLHEHIYRSSDGGKTWDDRTLLGKYGCETSLLALRDSPKMLAFIRYMRGALPGEDDEGLRKRTGWADLSGGQGMVFKNGVIAESHDKGRTWHNFRLFDTYGSVPGELIQGPDGRVAAVWLQRYPYMEAHIRVRISPDGGKTWGDTTYMMLRGIGYPSSVVRDDGTIVTVCENTDLDENGWPYRRTRVAAHWQMPAQ